MSTTNLINQLEAEIARLRREISANDAAKKQLKAQLRICEAALKRLSGALHEPAERDGHAEEN